MKKILIILLFINLVSCRVNYSFSGINIGKNIKTFHVPYIPNNAPIIIPGLNDEFKNELIDKITQNTNLEEDKNKPDLIFEAEITDYSVQPVSLTAEQTAAMNRLTIQIKLNYTNNKNEKDNFTKTYSHYYDYPATQSRIEIQDEAHKEIFEQILEDIFSDTLAKW
jgi:hypothetical protein